jgi:alkylation response protein AidB-like acyl-CoA dehydrogenase
MSFFVYLQLMGIETKEVHGGAECSFTSAIIAIEELAKVDPSVSVMADVHNTLVSTSVIRNARSGEGWGRERGRRDARKS